MRKPYYLYWPLSKLTIRLCFPRHGNPSPPPWYWFAILAVDTDAWITPFHPGYWRQAWWRLIAGPVYRKLIDLGVWATREGDYYVNGRWTLSPWDDRS